jgi:hypothetical protein
LKHSTHKDEKLRRTGRITIMLNAREMRALNVYCTRYRVKNKSEFLRETLMKTIVRRFEEEHPTLWEEIDPTIFSQETEK